MRRTALWLLFAILFAPTAQAAPGLSLHLDTARIAPNGGFQLALVDARWDNRTGAPIEAFTNFGGVFDGLALVIRDANGREVRRVHYTHHQSPYAQHRRVLLPRGDTREQIAFPLPQPLPPGTYEVHLEGGLVGSARHSSGYRSAALSVP